MGKFVRLYGCLTCMGRLSIKEIIPKMTNRKLVKMKARMALVSFWTFLSLFGGSDWLKGTHIIRANQDVWTVWRLNGMSAATLHSQDECETIHRWPLTPRQHVFWCLDLKTNRLHTSWPTVGLCFPLRTPSSSSPWCSQSEGRSTDTAAASYRRSKRRSQLWSGERVNKHLVLGLGWRGGDQWPRKNFQEHTSNQGLWDISQNACWIYGYDDQIFFCCVYTVPMDCSPFLHKTTHMIAR